MVHYLKGKLVAESQNGSSDIIHVHKNCAEWYGSSPEDFNTCSVVQVI